MISCGDYCTFVFGFTAVGPKFLTALVVNSPARSTAHAARAVSSSTAAIFSTPLDEPSHPSATE